MKKYLSLLLFVLSVHLNANDGNIILKEIKEKIYTKNMDIKM